MNDRRSRLGIGIATALALVVFAIVTHRFYFAPRAALREEVGAVRTDVNRYAEALRGAVDVEETIRAFADRTLGPDVETVDHRFRTRLNRIAEEIGLRGASVNTGNASSRPSPARSEFRGRRWRALRDRIDLVELDGSIAAEGTLEQVIELIDRLDAEPWLKRVTSVRIEPKKEGRRFATTVRLVTMFLPGRAPGEIDAPPWERARLERYAALAEGNPFRIPDAAPPAAPVVAEAPPAPPRFPWNQWILTGIAEGPQGPEVWLRNQRSGETRQLTIGGALNEARLLAVGAGDAEFELGARRFRLEVGRSFGDGSEVRE